MTDSDLFVRLKMRNGSPVADIISTTGDFTLDDDEEKKSRSLVHPERDDDTSEFAFITENFISLMNGYSDLVPVFGSIFPMLSRDVVINAIPKYLEKYGERINQTGDYVDYRLPQRRVLDFYKIRSSMKEAHSFAESFPDMVLIAIFSALEYQCAQYFRYFVRKYPAAIAGSKTVDAGAVLSAGSYEKFVSNFIEDEVEQFQRDSIDGQVKWLVKNLKIDDISTRFSDWPELMRLSTVILLFIILEL